MALSADDLLKEISVLEEAREGHMRAADQITGTIVAYQDIAKRLGAAVPLTPFGLEQAAIKERAMTPGQPADQVATKETVEDIALKAINSIRQAAAAGNLPPAPVAEEPVKRLQHPVGPTCGCATGNCPIHPAPCPDCQMTGGGHKTGCKQLLP